MRFQWYLVDTDDGTVQGCNDVEALDEFILDDRYVILSAQHGVYFSGSRDENSVEEFDTNADLDDEDLDDDEESEDDESEDDLPDSD